MTEATVRIPPKLIPVFKGEADVRGAHGGRGSAKTRTFAKMTAIRAYMWDQEGREGIILCGRQYMNSLADSSLEEIKAAIRSEPWLLPHFDIGEKYIRTVSGRISYTFSGLDKSVESIKSKARILLCWVDEAEPVTEQSWQVLIPTIREEGSELWVTWNPKRKSAAVESRFRNSTDPRFKIVEMNWSDNKWFPAKLDRERLRDLEERPEQYPHVWQGDYATVLQGAYYAEAIAKAKLEGRIGKVAADPLMLKHTYWDIGGTGRTSDAAVIWVVQFIGREIRVLDYYEAVGQELSAHIDWLRRRGYQDAMCILPHDGTNSNTIFHTTYRAQMEQAGFKVDVVKNQGAGAAKQRIEAARRLFPSIWFNAETTQPGLDALGWYHEKRDDTRQIGLGPNHDWASHGADAFGLMCIHYEAPKVKSKVTVRNVPVGAGSWMG